MLVPASLPVLRPRASIQMDKPATPALFALRGLLAYDVVLHSLKKRHRVDFGVNPQGKKRLAVPFRACDTPSERSEFEHPEMAIVLTCIAYYEQVPGGA